MCSILCEPYCHVGWLAFVTYDNQKEACHATFKSLQKLLGGSLILSGRRRMFFRMSMPKTDRMAAGGKMGLPVSVSLVNIPEDTVPTANVA